MDAINLRDFEPGDTVRLVDGREVEVLENPGDGAWLICREFAPGAPADAVFLAEIAGESD